MVKILGALAPRAAAPARLPAAAPARLPPAPPLLLDPIRDRVAAAAAVYVKAIDRAGRCKETAGRMRLLKTAIRHEATVGNRAAEAPRGLPQGLIISRHFQLLHSDTNRAPRSWHPEPAERNGEARPELAEQLDRAAAAANLTWQKSMLDILDRVNEGYAASHQESLGAIRLDLKTWLDNSLDSQSFADFHDLSDQVREEQKRLAFVQFELTINSRVMSLAADSAQAHETIAANATSFGAARADEQRDVSQASVDRSIQQAVKSHVEVAFQRARLASFRDTGVCDARPGETTPRTYIDPARPSGNGGSGAPGSRASLSSSARQPQARPPPTSTGASALPFARLPPALARQPAQARAPPTSSASSRPPGVRPPEAGGLPGRPGAPLRRQQPARPRAPAAAFSQTCEPQRRVSFAASGPNSLPVGPAASRGNQPARTSAMRSQAPPVGQKTKQKRSQRRGKRKPKPKPAQDAGRAQKPAPRGGRDVAERKA